MKYYCLHHSPAKERKDFLLPIFKKQEIDVEWIEEFLPNCDIVLNHPKVPYVHAANKNFLNNAELSLVFKHCLAIEKICSINDYAIIFEDDLDDFDFKLKDILPHWISQFEEIHGDILWIGSVPYKNLPTNIITVYNNTFTKDRCSHCYMIHSRTANKVIDFYKDIKAPSDWQWNLAIDYFNLKSCWSFPHIYQRTDRNKLKSLIR